MKVTAVLPVLFTPLVLGVPWETPLSSDYARAHEPLLNASNLYRFVWQWWSSQLGSPQVLVTALVLLSGYAGYLHGKSALTAGIVMLLWSPLVLFQGVRYAGMLALAFGIASLVVWLVFGK